MSPVWGTLRKGVAGSRAFRKEWYRLCYHTRFDKPVSLRAFPTVRRSPTMANRFLSSEEYDEQANTLY